MLVLFMLERWLINLGNWRLRDKAVDEEEELLVDVAATATADDDDGKTVGAELSIDRLFDDALLE